MAPCHRSGPKVARLTRLTQGRKSSAMQGVVIFAIWIALLLVLGRVATLPTWLLVIAGIVGALWAIRSDQRNSDRIREQAQRREEEEAREQGGPEWHHKE